MTSRSAPVESWRAPGSVGETPRDRALALSVFFTTGGLLCLVSVVLPAWPGRNVAVVVAVGLIAVVVGLGLVALAERVPAWVCVVLVAFGSMLIAGVMGGGGGGAASATYAGFYVWVAVYSFLFFSPRVAVTQVAFGVGCEIVALVEVGERAVAPAQVALSLGTVISTGIVVGLLTARVRASAATDALTGLPNRRALDQALSGGLGRLGRGIPSLAVLSVDLDGFKALNDRLGHAQGDRLLQQVARLWSAELRAEDLLARCGGDEFVVVLADCEADRARQVAQRLVAATPAPVSACVGLVVVTAGEAADGESRAHVGGGGALVDRVLARADEALYAGKARGPGSVMMATTEPLVIPLPRAHPREDRRRPGRTATT